MLLALDLTARQAARVLAQAVRAHAKLEIEPRPESCSALLWGSLAGREQDALLVDLYDSGRDLALNTLIGAMCDVRTILSGQLCIFASFIVEANLDTVPQRIALIVPESIQVANRRRFARKTPTEPVPVRVCMPDAQSAFVAVLANIGPIGLGCRVVNREVDDLLFIGDEVQLEFVLPWADEVYSLPGCVCGKTPHRAEGHLLVGFEFVPDGHESTLARLRAALNDRVAHLTETEGDL